MFLQKRRDLDTFIIVQRDQLKRRNGRERMVLEHRQKAGFEEGSNGGLVLKGR